MYFIFMRKRYEFSFEPKYSVVGLRRFLIEGQSSVHFDRVTWCAASITYLEGSLQVTCIYVGEAFVL